MQLAHAADNGLAGLFVGMYLERRVFFHQFLDGFAEAFLVGLRLRFDGNVDNRRRKFHLLEDNLVVHIAEGVACLRVFQADSGANIAGKRRFHVFAVVRMHAEDTTDALLLLRNGVIHVRSGIECPG